MPRLFRVIHPATMAVLTLALAACGDPYEFNPTRATIEKSFTAYAQSGTPLEYPTALATIALLPVRMDANARFDVAFDLDESGDVIVQTVRHVVSRQLSGRRVGLLVHDAPFDSVFRAPNGGYQFDSLLTVPVGTTVVIQAQRPSDCVLEASELVYSKIVIDSVRTAERLLFMRGVVDPSCGFRSFLPGIPES